jgi:hypothetical protein
MCSSPILQPCLLDGEPPCHVLCQCADWAQQWVSVKMALFCSLPSFCVFVHLASHVQEAHMVQACACASGFNRGWHGDVPKTCCTTGYPSCYRHEHM